MINLLRFGNIPHTITHSLDPGNTVVSGGVVGADPAKVIDGITNDRGTYSIYDHFRPALTRTHYWKVAFPTPITIVGIKVYRLYNFGRGGPKYGENNPHGAYYVNVNGVAILTLGPGGSGNGLIDGRYGDGNSTPNPDVNHVNFTDMTVRSGVTSVEVNTYGHGNGGDWWVRAGAGIGEVEIYVSGDEFGLII